MRDSKLTVWEAACIITGYGVGGGILAMPYLASRNGLLLSLLLLVTAFFCSWVLHMMIAELVVKCGKNAQIVGVFSRFLFKGKLKVMLTVSFFALMAFVLVTNLTAYIVGAAELLAGFLPVSMMTAEIIFYAMAASVVIFGLKAVGISEKYAVSAIFVLIGSLAAASIFAPLHALPEAEGTLREGVSYFSMAMLAFSAFFSIPQAVEGLEGDVAKIRKAVFLGLGNNLVLIVVITVCTLISSEEVTEVAMTGWSAAIGGWAQIIGGVFTVLAMLTTYWSISLALSGIVREQLRLNNKLCWLLATLPSLLLTLLNIGGFIDLLEMAGGAIAIIVAVMLIPAYRAARREMPGTALGIFGNTAFQIITFIAYMLMAVGSLL